MYGIDHLMIGANDLDKLATYFTDLTGLPVADGGSHEAWGTHNKLIATTSATYLELIAPNPAMEKRSPLRGALEHMTEPKLHRVIALASSDRFPAIVMAYEKAGVPAVVTPLSRQTRSGETLRWHLLIPAEDNRYGIFAPLFIDWGSTTHPSRSLPPAPCTLVECHAGHPDSEAIRRLWSAIGFEMPLLNSANPYLTIALDTPKGRIELTGA